MYNYDFYLIKNRKINFKYWLINERLWGIVCSYFGKLWRKLDLLYFNDRNVIFWIEFMRWIKCIFKIKLKILKKINI